MASCNSSQFDDFPDLRFTVDGNNYYIPRESYVEREFGMKCVVRIMHYDDMPFWILGLNFFHNYYTVFDLENKKVGFAPSKGAQVLSWEPQALAGFETE